MKTCMRVQWFEHVRKTRKKMSKAKEGTTHQAARREASTTWPQEKEKLLKKLKRLENKEKREENK